MTCFDNSDSRTNDDPSAKTCSRRSLLAKAGGGLVAFSLAGTLGFADQANASGRSYISGYNDNFSVYFNESDQGQTLLKLMNGNADCFRCPGISWSAIQPTATSPLNFSSISHIRDLAVFGSRKWLATISDIPSWAITPTSAANDLTVPRAVHPSYLPAFGYFVQELVRYLDLTPYGVSALAGLEIWNEPNLWATGNLPATSLADMVTCASVYVDSYNAEHDRSVSVISGGLHTGNSPFGPDYQWNKYLLDLDAATCTEFDVGIHAYDLTQANPSWTVAQALSNSSQVIETTILTALFQVANLGNGNRRVWLTETGCSSDGPWTAAGQSQVLSHVEAVVSSQPELASMVVHRLYTDNSAEPSGSHHHESGMMNRAGTSIKPAYGTLTSAWV